MASTALDDFVREALNRGAKPDAIAAELAAAGWAKRDVDAALAQWAVASFGLAVPKPKTYVSAREAFLYIVMFALLGLVAYNLSSLVFALIDRAIADALDTSTQYSRSMQVRSALSALAVATPLLAGFGWYIAKARRADPAMQQSRVRKWLTYVTLIVAALIFVGDLIALVYNFLSGDLSQRLLLKMVVVALISGGIFIFFVRDVETERARGKFGLAPVMAALGAAFVAVAFAGGLLSIENPIAAREYRLDGARVAAVRRVAGAAQCAYSFTNRIPRSYNEIRADFAERSVPVYGNCNTVLFTADDERVIAYQMEDASHIRLCTDFFRPSRAATDDPVELRYPVPDVPVFDERRPAAGRHCYRIRLVKLPPAGSQPGAAQPTPPPAPPAPQPQPTEPEQPATPAQ